jgi:hypothetical protein
MRGMRGMRRVREIVLSYLSSFPDGVHPHSVFRLPARLSARSSGGGAVTGGEGFSTTATIRGVGVGENESALGEAFYEVDDHAIDEGIAFGIDVDRHSVLFVDEIIRVGLIDDIDRVFITTATPILNPDPNAFISRFSNSSFQEGTQTEGGFFGKSDGHGKELLR